MGLVHKNLQEYPQAIERYEQALRIRRQQAHNDHDKIKVADTLYNMAIVFANTENYRSALDRYKEALRTYRETGMTDDHPSIINTLQWIRWAEKKSHKQQSKRNLVSSSSQK
jgi:tetratricopeptide (TPR) repeat protein